ncbi:MAG: type 2 isopentenyl-diphosphate Delta-isomerase [Bacteroidetes bacterium]|nr:type 2 isopentenyl-diphosphate Delta-isomerase [Bacteroidota bacterium]
MKTSKDQTSLRKKDHIEICLYDDVDYLKSSGFNRYVFEHNAITEVKYDEICLKTSFYGKEISYPFLISCMTGGTGEALNINSNLAEVAKALKIPIGVGSQRQVLENNQYLDSFKIFKKVADFIPVLSNIGAAQVACLKSNDPIKKIIDIVNASALVIHVNPLQELLQKEGEPVFSGLLGNIEKITKEIDLPIIVKEVGAGISKNVAKKLLDAGVKGIDVAGAGGTSWAGVELLRKGENSENYFWNWGLPTSYCVRTVKELKKDYDFLLIASGGIKSFDDIAKAIALGSDITASARLMLQKLNSEGIEGLINFITQLFENVKNIMYLTGCSNLREFSKVNLIKQEDLY